MNPPRTARRPTPAFLLIDAGNTRVKWAVGGRRGPRRTAGDVATGKVTANFATGLARQYPQHLTVLSSVVPKLLPAFRRAFRGRLLEVSAGMPESCLGPEFRFNYPKPAELGADRIAAAIAAQAQNYFPAIIVACGTATAYTVLDAKGRLCGGAIAPGVQAQLDALLGATAQLPATSLRPPRQALAKSTRDAINAGVVLSYLGGVKELVARLTDSLPRRPKPHIILTGGDAKLAAAALGGDVKLRPLLVLEGLHIIGTRRWMPA